MATIPAKHVSLKINLNISDKPKLTDIPQNKDYSDSEYILMKIKDNDKKKNHLSRKPQKNKKYA